MPLVWHFLLPGTGEHRLQAKGIGDNIPPEVILDGQLLPARPGQLLFTGPENSQLEIQKDSNSNWHLLVNGNRVEEYSPKKRSSGVNDGLRDVRNMAEGSYLISPQFDVHGMDLNVIRKFRFQLEGQIHEVTLAHSEDIWQIALNGAMIERQAHTWKDNDAHASFDVPTQTGLKLPGTFDMKWITRKFVWQYTMTINGVNVPPCWVKGTGEMDVSPVVIPAPAGLGSAHLSPKATPVFETYATAHEPTPALAPVAAVVPPAPEILPQGVSFDSSSGLFQSNIKSKAGRFVFLGEFKTAEEAHQRYLEAIPVHCPDKRLAPGT